MTCGYCNAEVTDCKTDIKAGPDADMDICRCACGHITEVKVFDNGTVVQATYPEHEAPDHIIELLNQED